MGWRGKRFEITIPVTGQTQQADLPLSLGEIDQIIVTSTVEGHSFDLTITNEHGDLVLGPRSVSCPSNEIRPSLVAIGVLTVKIVNPGPGTGTVTIVAIPREN